MHSTKLAGVCMALVSFTLTFQVHTFLKLKAKVGVGDVPELCRVNTLVLFSKTHANSNWWVCIALPVTSRHKADHHIF